MLVGKLLSLTKTRPNITHAISVVSRFIQHPQEAHMTTANHILCYVRRYPDLGLFVETGEENHLHGYTDANYGQVIDDKISIGAYIFFLGTHLFLGIPRSNRALPDRHASLNIELWLNVRARPSGLGNYSKNSRYWTTNQLPSTATIRAV